MGTNENFYIIVEVTLNFIFNKSLNFSYSWPVNFEKENIPSFVLDPNGQKWLETIYDSFSLIIIDHSTNTTIEIYDCESEDGCKFDLASPFYGTSIDLSGILINGCPNTSTQTIATFATVLDFLTSSIYTSQSVSSTTYVSESLTIPSQQTDSTSIVYLVTSETSKQSMTSTVPTLALLTTSDSQTTTRMSTTFKPITTTTTTITTTTMKTNTNKINLKSTGKKKNKSMKNSSSNSSSKEKKGSKKGKNCGKKRMVEKVQAYQWLFSRK